MKLLQLSAALIAAGVLAGCAPKGPEPIYYWGDYQQQVYSYYQKDSDPQKQIDALNRKGQSGEQAGSTGSARPAGPAVRQKRQYG